MPAALSHKRKLAFFSIPKSGSTSMKLCLYKLEHGAPFEGKPDDVHPHFKTYPVKACDFEDLDDYFKFTIVRDPVKRLLSSWGNRVFEHEDLLKSLPKRLDKRLRFFLKNRFYKTKPSAEYFFRNLISYQKANYSIWHHTVSIKAFVGEDLSFFDKVYRLEAIGELEKDLSERTGLDIVLPREQVGGPKVLYDELPSDVQDFVRDYTRQDYLFLKDYYSA
jgi:hypothetical protein